MNKETYLKKKDAANLRLKQLADDEKRIALKKEQTVALIKECDRMLAQIETQEKSKAPAE